MSKPEANVNKHPESLKPLLLGVILFLSLNGWLLLSQPLSKMDPESLPAAHTWVWWATQEYLNTKPSPPIVLLGSSLLMHPISRQDADFLNKDLDYVHHHRSIYMEEQLESRFKQNSLICFNFALPGGMMSDDYIVARALFSGKQRPKLVVLGLSVRDFMDNGVHCAGATPAFRYLKRFTNVDDLISIAMPQWWQRLDYWVGKAVYLWGKKLDIQVALSEESKKILTPMVTSFCNKSQLDNLDLSRNLASNLRSEVEEGMFIVKTHQPYSFENNSKEYIKRYRSPNQPLFEIQKQFLEKTLSFCSQENIAVLVINMPLTKQNIALIPKGSYQQYVSTLAHTCQQWNCSFVDLNQGSNFPTSTFYDTSHMNATGGKKLVDIIVNCITNNNRLASSLLPSPKHIELAGNRPQLH